MDKLRAWLRWTPEAAGVGLLAWFCFFSKEPPAPEVPIPPGWAAHPRASALRVSPGPGDGAAPAWDPSCWRSAAPAPGVRLEAKTVEVPVSGDTAEQLDKSIQVEMERQDIRNMSDHTLGFATADLAPDCRCIPLDDGSVRAQCETRLESAIYVPDWDEHGSASLRRRWHRALRTIRAHELSHRAVSIQVADRLQRELGRLHAGSCDELTVRLLRLRQAASEEEDRRQDQFHASLVDRPTCNDVPL